MSIRSKHSGQRLDEVRLSRLSVRCKIGIYPEEARTLQALHVNLVIYLSTKEAAISGQLEKSVDYAVLSREVTFILTQSNFRLVESAAEALAAYILSAGSVGRVCCEAVEVELTKPEALQGQCFPSVRIFREQAADVALEAQSPLYKIFEAAEVGLFRVIVQPLGQLVVSLATWQVKAVMPEGSEIRLADGDEDKSEQLFDFNAREQLLRNKSPRALTFLLVAKREPQLYQVARGSFELPSSQLYF